MTRSIIILMACLLTLNCAGAFRKAEITEKNQQGDNELTCQELTTLTAEIDQKIEDKKFKRSGRRFANASAGIVGVLVFPPLLLAMDLSKTETIELESLERRKDQLNFLFEEKNCSTETNLN